MALIIYVYIKRKINENFVLSRKKNSERKERKEGESGEKEE